MMLILILFLSALNGIQGGTEGGKIVPCVYWEESSLIDINPSRFTIDNLNVTNCTHLLYLSEPGSQSIEEICSGDYDVDYTDAIPKLGSKKIGHPNLKIFLRVSLFDSCLRHADEKRNFTSAIVTFLQAYGFDGLADVARSPVKNEEWENLVKFQQELRRKLEDHQLSLMLLTETSKNFSVSQTKNDAFIVLNHCNTLEHYVAHLKDKGSKAFKTEKCIQEILDLGVDPSKILIPLAFMGPRMISETQIRGPISNLKLKFLNLAPYYEFCLHLQDLSWISGYDEETKTSLLIKDREVILYESQQRLIEIINYVKQKQLGGLMVMYPEYDDFEGRCRQGKNPYLSTIGKELFVPSSMKPSGGSNSDKGK